MIIILLDAHSARIPKVYTLIRQFGDADNIAVAVAMEGTEQSEDAAEHVGQFAKVLGETALRPRDDTMPRFHALATVHTRAANARRGAGSIDPPQRNSGKFLSGRQAEVMLLLSRGLSNKQIARELDMSDNTVRVHLKKIFRKLNVANRTQAAMYANTFAVNDEAVVEKSTD